MTPSHCLAFLPLLFCALAAAAFSNVTGEENENQSGVRCEGVSGNGEAARGRAVYETRCFGCHSIDQNRVGPKHRGVFNRAAGAVPDYSYSAALMNSGLTWDAATLDAWLAGPTKLVPGTRMGFTLKDAADRADVIAYLKSQTPTEDCTPVTFRLPRRGRTRDCRDIDQEDCGRKAAVEILDTRMSRLAAAQLSMKWKLR